MAAASAMRRTASTSCVQTRSCENLQRRDLEEHSADYWTKHGSGPQRILASRARQSGPKSLGVPNLSLKYHRKEEQDLARQNMALEESCLVYEAMIASLQTAQISYSFKAEDILSTLGETAATLRKEKQDLMEACWRLQDRIDALKGYEI